MSILKGFAPETIMTAFLFSMIGYFNGNNRTVWVMTQGIIQTLLIRLPFAYVIERPARCPSLAHDRSGSAGVDDGGRCDVCRLLLAYESQKSNNRDDKRADYEKSI